MDMLWETYERAIKNDDPTFNRVLYFASRDSFKTLGAAILEVLAVMHLDRDVAHMAAIESQSRKSQQYVKKFLSSPILRDYVVGDNQEITWIVRYLHKGTGDNLTEDQFKELPKTEQDLCEEVRHFIRIVICTMAGANSEHVPLFVVDEVDVVRDPRAYEEAKFIPAPRDGKMPITVLTSTRKFSFGLVQKEIDQARETGLKIRHWNIIDVTQACPPERHKPDLPKLTVYRSDEELRAVSEATFEEMSPERQDKYVRDENVMAGCSTCKLYPMCQGRLATKQTSRSSLLKPIDHTINQFYTASLPNAQAQLLCKKPSTEGLIYPQFDRDVHMLTASEMAERITGDKYPETLTKTELVAIMKAQGMKPSAGMDFGYTHNFAAVAGFTDGYRAYCIEVMSQAELDPVQKVELSKKQLKYFDPVIYPDPEDPGMAKILRKSGFRMKEWKKTPGSVRGGIDIVRMLMRPAVGEPRFYLLAGDEGCELLAKRISAYHWALQPDGTIGKDPDDELDDECDALRYWLMNVFAPRGTLKVGRDPLQQTPEEQARHRLETAERKWFNQILAENGVNDNAEGTLGAGSQGSFKWNI